MKIAILKKAYCIEIQEAKLKNDLEPDEIRAKTVISALKLGTDRGNFEGAEDVPGAPTYPRWVGDSNLAIVEEIGSNVQQFKVGDKVIAQLPHQSEWIASENSNVCVVPDGIKDEDAVWATLYSLSGFCYTKGGFIPGENVAVVGLGILGLGAIALGPIYGANKTIAIGNSEIRNKMAESVGADHSVLSDDKNLEEKLNEFTNNEGIDLVILTANPWDAYISSLKSVRSGGRIANVALSGRGEEATSFNPFPMEHFYFKGISIIAVSGGYPTNPRMAIWKTRCLSILNLMKKNKLNPSVLNTHRMNYTKIPEAYDLMTKRDKQMLGVIFDWEI
jgi:threonine dehydrogenase-like Zn-dependent dehydrogenase|tara:strand:+ start:117 stop:1115 length:999 start_codon:yes stop_codon:yes gene_type:complete